MNKHRKSSWIHKALGVAAALLCMAESASALQAPYTDTYGAPSVFFNGFTDSAYPDGIELNNGILYVTSTFPTAGNLGKVFAFNSETSALIQTYTVNSLNREATGPAVDKNGTTLYVATFDSNAIFSAPITTGGGTTVTTLFAGNAVSGALDAPVGPGTVARFKQPNKLKVDSSGNVFVGDAGNNKIRKINPASLGVVTTFAGSGVAGDADGTGTAATFNQPVIGGIDSTNTIFVADFLGHTIRKITPAGVVTTIAGVAGSAGDLDGTGTSARFNAPFSAAHDVADNLYIVDRNNRKIKRITPEGVGHIQV